MISNFTIVSKYLLFFYDKLRIKVLGSHFYIHTLKNKPQSLKYQSEIKSNIQTEKIEGKKIIFPFSIKIRKKKKPLKLKTKRHLKTIKAKSSEIENIDIPELQNQHDEIIEDNKPINSTFTLRIDNQGNLVGLNIKKPKSTKDSKFRRFLHFKRTHSSESGEKEIEKSNIKEKIKGIFSKLKRK